jgi:outer membrane receptor protein involved in Fe transport
LYHHQGRIQIEPEFIKSIELEAGAGAATNGMGVLGGEVYFTTKDAFDMLRRGQDVGALFKGVYRFSGDNAYKGVASVYGKLSGNIGLLGAFTYDDGEDYADGHGNSAEPTAYTHQNGYLKFNADYGDQAYRGVIIKETALIGLYHPLESQGADVHVQHGLCQQGACRSGAQASRTSGQGRRTAFTDSQP